MAVRDGEQVEEDDVIATGWLDLPCRLTDPELIERGQRLAETLENIKAEDSRQEMLKREMKSQAAALEAKRDALVLVVARREELRRIEFEDVIAWHLNVVRRVRKDTGEIVTERFITKEERQQRLDLENNARAGVGGVAELEL